MAKTYKNLNEIKKVNDEKLDKDLAAMSAAGFDISSFNKKSYESELNWGGFNWFEINNLPSLNKFYPEGTKIYGKALSLLDLKLLSTMNENMASSIAMTVVNRNIKIESLETLDNLLVQDLKFLIFWLRNITYADNTYTFPYYCSHCNEKNIENYNMSKVLITTFDTDFNNTMKLDSGEIIEFKPLTIADEKEIEKYIKANIPEKSGMDNDMIKIFHSVKNINGNLTNIIEVKQLFDKNFNNFATAMIKYYEINNWGPKKHVECICQKCGGMTEIGLSFLPDFFLPGLLIEDDT